MLNSTPNIQYREHWPPAPDEQKGRGHSGWQGFSQRWRKSVRLEPNEPSGALVESLQRLGRGLKDMRRMIERVLQDTEHNQHNVIIRPHLPTATLIQLDDFMAEKVARVEPFAFLTVCTSTGNYQAWLAVSDGLNESQREVDFDTVKRAHP